MPLRKKVSIDPVNAQDSEQGSAFQTPMMQQYIELKKQYPDCILFFRLGDFYELFLDDAKVGSQILGITLTRRSRGKDGAIPMCGVPYHAVDMYLPKLVQAGYRVAIAEQVTSPKDTPHLVERKVIRIVTAGTLIEGRSVNERESAYVAVVVQSRKQSVIGYADLATGQFFLKSVEVSGVVDELHQIRPKELLLSPTVYNSPEKLKHFISLSTTNIATYPEWDRWSNQADALLKQHLSVKSLKAYDLEDPLLQQAASVLLGYLIYTQRGDIPHLQSVQVVQDTQYLHLDSTTIESLELFSSTMDKTVHGSVLHVIDKTLTPMGARLLKDWLVRPLAQRSHIEHRLDQVAWCVQQPRILRQMREILSEITDIERQLSKLAVRLGTARDLIGLRDNLQRAEECLQLVIHEQAFQQFHLLKGKTVPISAYIEDWIQSDPPGITKVGGMINAGKHPELDRLREIHEGVTTWLTDFESIERERTGIPNLKVGFNSVFGFYIEISKAHQALVKEEFGYQRKQTLVNAERYITQELKIQEEKVLSAKERIDAIEFELFEKVAAHIVQQSSAIQSLARAIAHMDCMSSFALLSVEHSYTRPILTTDRVLTIEQGRHPVVEETLGGDFVPNPTHMSEDERFFLLTGPNMAGKSTYIRQVALIVLFAHIGCFVPAESAVIPLTDRIFSRIGASDALHKGLSTFMVEMTETAKILHQLTTRSLIIFDEIGRGTGMGDGMSLAQAIAEYSVTIPERPFVFFATHYHELAQLAEQLPHVKNYVFLAKLHRGKLLFLYTLQPGSSEHSFGIEVAEQAGLPTAVITRARQLRTQLVHIPSSKNQAISSEKKKSSSEIEEKVKKLELIQISPKAALDLLYSWQAQLQEGSRKDS